MKKMKKIFLALLACLLISTSSQAAIFNVTTTADELDGCGAGTGCSIREAVELANLTPGYDEIQLPTNHGSYIITLGQITIRATLQIKGMGGKAVIDGQNNSNRRFLYADSINFASTTMGVPPASVKTVTLNNLQVINFSSSEGGAVLFASSSNPDTTSPTLTVQVGNSDFTNNHGNTTGGAFFISGNIYNLAQSEATFGRSTFSDNNVNANGSGGAIFAYVTKLNLLGNTFTNNTASLNGGAIQVAPYSDLLVYEGSFTGNQANNIMSEGGAIGIESSSFVIYKAFLNNNSSTNSGGAVSFYHVGCINCSDTYNGSIAYSSFYQNSANSGGGLKMDRYRIDQSDTTNLKLSIMESSFVDNEAVIKDAIVQSGGTAGAINVGDGYLRISYSTLTGNIAENDIDTGAGALQFIGDRLEVKASIVSQNSNRLPRGEPVSSDCMINSPLNAESYGYNVLGTSCALTNNSGHPDQLGVNPLFGNQRMVSGQVAGYELTVSSPAVDTAETAICTSLEDYAAGYAFSDDRDQTFLPRVGNGRCDAGSLEFQCTPTAFYSDADGDGFGTGVAVTLCGTAVNGFANNNTDCDDALTTQHSLASPETCDNADNNCDGRIDEGFADANNNGIADCAQIEICDGIDNNTNGQTDEGFDDTDGDSHADCVDECVSDATKQFQGLCGCGNPDTDADADGTPQCFDTCEGDANKISPGECGCGLSDKDNDGDGIAECIDLCDADPAKSEPGICGCGVLETDTDFDGAPDCVDECDTDGSKKEVGICGCNLNDNDADNDGQPDCVDLCINDPAKSAPGTCGCGVADIDSDGDGVLNCQETCDFDAAKTSEGFCGCGTPDTDTDGDTTPDCSDSCLDDASKTAPGICDCNVADTDTDSDGIADCIDAEECDDLDNNGDGNINEGLDCSENTPIPTPSNKSSGGGCSLSAENSSPSNGLIVSLLMAANLLLIRKKILS